MYLYALVNSGVVSYSSESGSKLSGSVICHLGEAHLGSKAKGKILNYLSIDEKK